MGDGFDCADIERFTRSQEGRKHLDAIRKSLVGRTIKRVDFSNETQCLATELLLDDDDVFIVFQPTLTVEALREQFNVVLEREYYVDFPERKTMEV